MHFINRSRVSSSVVSSCWQSRYPQGQVQRSSSAGSHCCNPVRLSRHWQVTSLFHFPLFRHRVVFCSAAWRLNSCELHLVLLSLRTLYLLLGGPAAVPSFDGWRGRFLASNRASGNNKHVSAGNSCSCFTLDDVSGVGITVPYSRRDRCGTRKVLSLTLRYRTMHNLFACFPTFSHT